MIYLTQAHLNFATALRRRLRDGYDWHQAVWQVFPGRDGQQRDFLTRLDTRDDGFRLLIVSPVQPTRPSWWPGGPEAWQTKPVPESFFSRGRYAFQLRANPTKKVAVKNPDGTMKKHGRREPLRTPDELLAWLQRKAAQGGFAVERSEVHREGREAFIKNGRAGTHSTVDFRGVLVVKDPAAFQQTFRTGIGSAKAFGFGLLVIAPLQ